jgi:hemerythrin-like domain-containing protein
MSWPYQRIAKGEGTMRPTEVLKKEHKAIELMLKVLEKFCEKIEAEKEVNREHLDQILEFIKVFGNKCHHAKEEELLFPALEEMGMPREGGPIGVMLTEHDLGRDYVKGMSEAFERYKEGDKDSLAKIVENAQNYVTLLREHIDKEDTILYHMADMHLSAGKEEELLAGFERLEQERIGADKHEGFHRLLQHLEEIYLK